MLIDIARLKQLREQTSISVSECKKALEEAGGDIEKARQILRKLGAKVAEKKMSKETGQGLITSYIHTNQRLGVLLDLRCETDFVAKSPEFKKLAQELCLQIAAMNPLFLKGDDVPPDYLRGERDIYAEQFKNSGKPQKIVDEIISGKLEKHKAEICLLAQPWIKDETKTIKELVDGYIAKLGENIIVKRFIRYEL